MCEEDDATNLCRRCNNGGNYVGNSNTVDKVATPPSRNYASIKLLVLDILPWAIPLSIKLTATIVKKANSAHLDFPQQRL